MLNRPGLFDLSRDLIWLLVCVATLGLWAVGIVGSPLPGWIVGILLLIGAFLFVRRIIQPQ